MINEIEKVIEEIRNSSHFTKFIYTNGDCYKFAKLLKSFYPDGEIYVMSRIDNDEEKYHHAVFKFSNIYYDINGQVKDFSQYQLTKVDDKLLASSSISEWSTTRNGYEIQRKSEYVPVLLSSKTIGSLKKVIFDDDQLNRELKNIEIELEYSVINTILSIISSIVDTVLKNYYLIIILLYCIGLHVQLLTQAIVIEIMIGCRFIIQALMKGYSYYLENHLLRQTLSRIAG